MQEELLTPIIEAISYKEYQVGTIKARGSAERSSKRRIQPENSPLEAMLISCAINAKGKRLCKRHTRAFIHACINMKVNMLLDGTLAKLIVTL